jgi:hypothetical protein
MSLRYPPPFPPLMQCAAVTSRLRPGLSTTLAVQKWSPLGSRTNSAPILMADSARCSCSLIPAGTRPVSMGFASRSRCSVQ